MQSPEILAHETHETHESSDALPLRLSEELWGALSSVEQGVYRRAESLLGELEPTRAAPIGRLLTMGPGGEVLRALEILEGMDLIRVEPGTNGPLVKLIALPADHVPIVGPDGRRRWVFIAQPIDAPVVDPTELN